MSKDKTRYNGCGPDISGGTLHDETAKFFNSACLIHDEDYSKSEITRKEADEKFLKNMLDIASSKPLFKRIYLKTAAYLYYAATRVFGVFFYTKGDEK